MRHISTFLFLMIRSEIINVFRRFEMVSILPDNRIQLVNPLVTLEIKWVGDKSKLL